MLWTSEIWTAYFIDVEGAKYSFVLRAFAHGAMGRRIVLHGVDPFSYFSFQPVLHDVVTKAVVCAVLSVGWCI